MKSKFDIEIEIPGLLRIQAFRNSEHELTDDDTTFSLFLEPGDDPIYIKKYCLKKSHDNQNSLLAELAGEVKRFLAEGMVPALKLLPVYSTESGTSGALDYQQIVAIAGENRLWIARSTGKLECEYYFLLHWVGAPDRAEPVVAAITSFEVF